MLKYFIKKSHDSIFCDVAPYSVADLYHSFGEISCLHLQVSSIKIDFLSSLSTKHTVRNSCTAKRLLDICVPRHASSSARTVNLLGRRHVKFDCSFTPSGRGIEQVEDKVKFDLHHKSYSNVHLSTSFRLFGDEMHG
jgi:hypothetical protein